MEEDGVIISDEELLPEQIAKRFGFTDDDLSEIDLRPKLYFRDEQKYKTQIHSKKYGL